MIMGIEDKEQQLWSPGCGVIVRDHEEQPGYGVIVRDHEEQQLWSSRYGAHRSLGCSLPVLLTVQTRTERRGQSWGSPSQGFPELTHALVVPSEAVQVSTELCMGQVSLGSAARI